MVHGINAAVAAYVPTCAKRIDATVYFMAVRCQSYEEAYSKWLCRIEHLLPIPLVKPWERAEENQKKVLATTSQYTQGNTDPVDHDHRATEASRSVAEFSEGARKPERRGKNSPQKRGPSRIPVEYVCKGCGRDVRRSWAHDKCMDPIIDWTAHSSTLAPKAGMFRGKRK